MKAEFAIILLSALSSNLLLHLSPIEWGSADVIISTICVVAGYYIGKRLAQ